MVTSAEQQATEEEAPTIELRSRGKVETQAIGRWLGEHARPGDIVLLNGPLGSGKTALTQGIARGLGVVGAVNSPTFTILKEYAGRVPFYHFDLYRLDDPAELDMLGFAPYFDGDGIAVVEWAERGEARDDTGSTTDAVWPPDWLRIELTPISANERLLRCTAVGERGVALLHALADSGTAVENAQLRVAGDVEME